MNILETANVLSRFGVIFTLIFSDMYRTVRRVISFRETNTENKIYRISRSNAVDTLLQTYERRQVKMSALKHIQSQLTQQFALLISSLILLFLLVLDRFSRRNSSIFYMHQLFFHNLYSSSNICSDVKWRSTRLEVTCSTRVTNTKCMRKFMRKT